MMIKTIKCFLGASCILLATTLFANIAIGVVDIQPLDKKQADYSALNGMKLAVHTINQKGGVLGQPLELVVKQVPAHQAAITLEAFNRDPIIKMVVTLQDQSIATLINATGQTSSKILISTNAIIATKSGHYSLAPTHNAQAIAAAQYVFNLMHRNNALILYPDTQPVFAQMAHDFSQVFRTLKGRVRQSIGYQGNTLSEPTLSAINNKKYDIIYLLADTSAVNSIIKQLRLADIKTPIIGSNIDDLTGLLKMNRSIANDIYFTTNGFFDINFNTDAMNTFLQEYQKMFKQKPVNYSAAVGYDAVTLLAKAVMQAKTTQPINVTAVMNKWNNVSGLATDYDFTISSSVKMVSVVKIIEGKAKLAAIVIPQYPAKSDSKDEFDGRKN